MAHATLEMGLPSDLQVVYPALPDVPPGAYLVHGCSQAACPPSDAVSFQGAQQRCFDAACKLLETNVLANDSAAYFWCAEPWHEGIHLLECKRACSVGRTYHTQ